MMKVNFFVTALSCLLVSPTLAGVRSLTPNHRSVAENNGPFLEENGYVIMEAESVQSKEPNSEWIFETSVPGYKGAGYYRMIGNGDGNGGGVGRPNSRISYFMKITNPGSYRMAIRSLKNGTESDQLNDCFTKLVDHQGYQGGDVKTFLPGKSGIWSERTRHEPTHGEFYDPMYNFSEPGVYELQVSGRSWGYLMDRIILYNSDMYDDGDVFSFLESPRGASSRILDNYPDDPNQQLYDIARICCGCEGAPFTDSENKVWSVDTDFIGGRVFAATNPINGTVDDGLYQNERNGGRKGKLFSYNIDLPKSGVYKLTLFFAEIFHTLPGARMFTVFIEDIAPSSLFEVDLVADAGSFTAIQKTVWVEVADETLNIDFAPIKDQAKVSAILVESAFDPAGPAPTNTPVTAAPVTSAPVTTAPIPAPVAAPVAQSSPISAPVSTPVAAPVTGTTPKATEAPVGTTVQPPTPEITPPKTTPASSPSPPSGGGNGGGMCFSFANTVEVQDKGFISMDSLQVGDSVRAGKDRFSRVFSFIHLDRDVQASFLQIHTEGLLNDPIEMTPEHMVFINGAALRASEVKVGDMLGESKVTEIKSISRRGVFAPVTESGDIVVSGVLASSYSAILDYAPVNQHYGAHAFFAARRMVCTLNFGICKSESYNEDGHPTWLSSVIRFFTITMDTPELQFYASAVALPFITVVFLLEQMILSPSLLLLGVSIVGFYVRFNKKTKVSKVKTL